MLREGEKVVFFETYAYRKPCGSWVVPVRGRIFAEKSDSWQRKRLFWLYLRTLRRYGFDVRNLTEDQRVRLQKSGWPFFVDGKSLRKVMLRFSAGGKSIECITGYTDLGGYFIEEVSEKTCPGISALVESSMETGRLEVCAPLDDNCPPTYTGYVYLMPREPVRYGVITDIDDTIRHTVCSDAREIMYNTFVRDFIPVAGMAALYRRLARKHNLPFFYVSSSMFQLTELLREFIQKFEFPPGAFHLARWGFDFWNNDDVRDPYKIKIPEIEKIFSWFPNQKFLLFGDNGQHDPEIYTELAAQHPSRIGGIFIRRVVSDSPDRYSTARSLLSDRRVVLFQSDEIEELERNLASEWDLD